MEMIKEEEPQWTQLSNSPLAITNLLKSLFNRLLSNFRQKEVLVVAYGQKRIEIVDALTSSR